MCQLCHKDGYWTNKLGKVIQEEYILSTSFVNLPIRYQLDSSGPALPLLSTSMNFPLLYHSSSCISSSCSPFYLFLRTSPNFVNLSSGPRDNTDVSAVVSIAFHILCHLCIASSFTFRSGFPSLGQECVLVLYPLHPLYKEAFGTWLFEDYLLVLNKTHLPSRIRPSSFAPPSHDRIYVPPRPESNQPTIYPQQSKCKVESSVL